MKFITRAYNSFEINTETRASIIKHSNEDRLLGEIEYYEHIPPSLQVYFPRMLDCYKNVPYAMELEYYSYDNLGKVMVEKDFDPLFWEKCFDFIGNYINQYRKKTATSPFNTDSDFMFIEKTLSEYGKLVENFEFFNKFDEYSEFILNDERLLPLKTIWEKLETYIKKHYIKEYNFIHGDLCFSNILYGVHPSNEDVILKFIDPRGVFGKTAFYGDFYYDLAKLSHSCNGGYEYFIYDKFNIDTNKNIFTLSYENNNKEMVYEKFLKTLDEYSNINRTKIKLVEGLIFIGMCARHYDSLERQKAMFITGLKLLNEVYEEI